MRDFLLINKLLFKNAYTPKEGKVKKTIMLYLFIIVYFGVLLTMAAKESLSVLVPLHMEGIVVKGILTTCFVLLMIRTLFSSIDVLFLSKDNEVLLTYPIKTRNIFACKNLVLASYSSLSSLIFILPTIGYLAYLTNNWILIVYALIVGIIFPIIPTFIVTSLMTFLVLHLRFLKNKTFIQYVGIIVSVIVLVGVFGITSMTSQEELTEQDIIAMAETADSTLSQRYLEIFNPISDILTGTNSIRNINILLGLSVVTGVACTFVCDKPYIKTLGIKYMGSKGKQKDFQNKDFKPKSIAHAILSNDFKTIIKVPIYLMQILIPAVLLPVLFFSPFLIRMNSLEEIDLPSLEVIKTFGFNHITLTVLVAMFGSFMMFNASSAVAFTKYGKDAVVFKTLPISNIKLALLMNNTHFMLSIISMIYVIVLAWFLFNYPIWVYLLLLVIFIIIALKDGIMGVMLDLKNPKLDWDTEMQAVKQNVNLLMYIGLCLADVVLTILISIWAKTFIMAAVYVLVIQTIELIIISTILKKKEATLFKEII